MLIGGLLILVAVGLWIYGRAVAKLYGPSLAAGLEFAVIIDALAVLYFGDQPRAALLLFGAAAIWTVLWLPQMFRRRKVITRYTFSTDRATVFAYLSDFRTQLQYEPRIQSVEKLTGGPVGVGTRFQTRTGRISPIEVVTVFDRDHRYVSQIEGDPMTGTATFETVVGGTDAMFELATTIDYGTALVGLAVIWPIAAGQMRDRRRHAWARVDDILKRGGQRTKYD